ncbi:hypothetical protein Poli38472_001083 [Pythium oligandrum]|uniref:Microsomal glutathione S-transferase 1 n=1 Tax=Pythium oligandrum TaxID=41045 RepID=A0A8K1FRE8_PYTOL|nr:hypothetical protein Poli38472_001083 [Pythium oligandrum]|eukprot:TMW68927.1 hypothetical protein Poli38472_001083 [Pythium oligandrum]
MPYFAKTYVTCVTLLFLKFVTVTGIQATKSFEAGGHPPEDKDLPLAKGKPAQNYGFYVEDVDETGRERRATELRWQRIVLNDLESIPLALIVFGTGLISGKTNEAAQTAALVVYTVLRFVHTFAYAKSLQPYRTFSWQFGIVAILAGAINSLVGVYRM